MKNKNLFLSICFIVVSAISFAQEQKATKLHVGTTTATSDASAALDVTSTTKGFLPPRMTTTERDNINSAAKGLMVYNTTLNCLQVNTGTPATPVWTCLSGTAATDPSTNGTGVVSAYACNTASAGTMTAGTMVSGVTQTITATVTTAGTYSISTTENGVTFAATGTFAGTGAQTIVLNATDTPTAVGTNAFALNTTPGCSFNRTTAAATPSVTSSTGKTWMDRNLGATQVATSSTDVASYGDLYQWGRNKDGHQIRTSSQTAGPVAAGTEGVNFITSSISPYDWLTVQDNNRWQTVGEANNPCPSGYRLPTETELNNERTAFSTNNAAGAYASALKLPVAGLRNYSFGTLFYVGSNGYYWSSTVSGTSARYLNLYSSNANMSSNGRAYGFSVRCIKD